MKAKALEETLDEIDHLTTFVKNKLAGLLNVEGDVQSRTFSSRFDIPNWIHHPDGTPMSGFAHPEPLTYHFCYTEGQLSERRDLFKRYGTHANALSKIVTRVSNVESLFRKIRVEGKEAEKEEENPDTFIRYSLSN